MPKGKAHLWTREELERVVSVSGDEEHRALAEELGLARNTIYSTRQRIRVQGGMDNFLENQRIAGDGLLSRRSETIAEQLERLYLVNIGAAGRSGGQPQYTVTIPSQLAARFVEQFGRQIRFEPVDDGIKIVPVPKVVISHLPSWAGRENRTEPDA